MNIFLYTIIFIIGTLFGSFYTLAVYRIPRKKDIIHTHSFCPNCNNKLGFFELIPILSYVFLGGKCKHCGQKIRPRYLILEVLSGITYLVFAYIIGIDANNLKMQTIAEFSFFVLYLCAIFIIAGIANESRKIEKSVLYYAVTVSLGYILYLCIIENASIYRYAMYLIALIFLFIIDTIYEKKKRKICLTCDTLILIIVMAIFTGEILTSFTIITTLILIAIIRLTSNSDKHFKKNRNLSKEVKTIEKIRINIPFYLCVFNIIDTIYVYILLSFYS